MSASPEPEAPTRPQTRARLAIAAILSLLAAMVLLASVAAGDASALVHEWRCKPENDTWCFDPNGLADWHQAKVKLEKGYDAYLCIGLFKEGWTGTYACSSEPVPYGTAIAWKFGTTYSGYDPLHGAGLQDNSHGNAEEIWNWFYEP